MAAAGSSSAHSSDNFQLVSRKRGKRKAKQPPQSPYKCNQADGDEAIDVHKVTKRISECRTELTTSDFYKQLLGTAERAVASIISPFSTDSNSEAVESQQTSNIILHETLTFSEQLRQKDLDILVYGLGNFVTCVIARYQLALVLALRDHLKVSPEHLMVYDPQFTNAEKQILRERGCHVIERNEEGKRQCQRPTLVVMPHCGKALFNNFLWANWGPELLQHIVIIGNSFSSMLDSLPERLWRNHLHFVSTIHPFVEEETVTNNFTYTDIFNDLSVHWFPLTNLQQVPLDVWTNAEEPLYCEEDLEIILDSLNKL